jgi:hypothetical protein
MRRHPIVKSAMHLLRTDVHRAHVETLLTLVK